MASIKPHNASKHKPVHASLAKVSAYDQVSGLLVAVLFIVGAGVCVLFVIYLTTQNWETNVSIPVIIEPSPGRGNHAMGVAQDLEAPGLEELEEVLEPQIEANYEAVTDAVTSQQAALENVDGTSQSTDGGTGQGDSRPLGPEGNGADIVPRWERWQIEYAGSDLSTYAKQLDHFGIELGTAGGGVQTIDYASQFTARTPKQRSASGKQEDRLYFTWKSGSLREADLDLLKRAGVKSQGRIPMQFYPPDTENLLAFVEQQYMGDRPLQSIQKTVFGIRPTSDGYEFYVMRQLQRYTR
ncbi:hypothetical protein [Bremerella alba]|uniref:Uncharacterized protein n=1 Tax=Bremerella alba TaxID=980252 RepID=A0A7V9A7C1_9BACT|nr:hypothetical protein [Bremerella alba]MBA2114831.1 hypothetical protein [Bremerella alba]